MALTIVTISIGKDNQGKEITVCTPHAVVLSQGDTIAWGSVQGDHEVRIDPADQRTRPIVKEPWTGSKGQISNPVGTVVPGAAAGFYTALATLILVDGTRIDPGGAIIIIRP